MTQEEFQKQFGVHLNQQQKEAVYTVDGRILLLAVPGSGKTTVLVTRLGYMVHCAGIHPRRILTVTFTKAAAQEMQERFARLFGEEYSRQIEFCTINSLCYQMILEIGRRQGRPPFQMIENSDAQRLIRELYREINHDFATESVVKDVQNAITYIKNMSLTEKEIREKKFATDHMDEIYKRYHSALREHRLMDYDDQLVYAHTLLSRYPEILKEYQSRFSHICVDEAQDTSRLQHAIIQKLAEKSGNLFMVGDEDQSIYGFRGAYPMGILQFPKQYPGTKVLTMEENYRSAEPIVEVANKFIAQNTLRHPKTIRATRGMGKKVDVIPVLSREDQYAYLLEHAVTGTMDTAILFRNNDSAVPLIDLLERNGISYNYRKKDTGFFSHRIITDIRNILQFAREPYNTDLFMDIYYKIGLRIKKEQAQYVCAQSRKTGKTILGVIGSDSRIPSYVKENALNSEDVLSHVKNRKPYAVLGEIWNALDYQSYVQDHNMDSGKYQILRILAQQEESCGALLNRLDALQDIIESHINEGRSALTISTIHSSKGLEYPCVYLLDVLDGILPQETGKNIEDVQMHEEDRRVCYVGITRAQQELHVFRCRLNHSEFISDIRAITDGIPLEKQKTIPKAEPKVKNICLRETVKPEPQKLEAAVGLKIRHKKMGPGVIQTVAGDVVTVLFTETQKVSRLMWHVVLENHLLDL